VLSIAGLSISMILASVSFAGSSSKPAPKSKLMAMEIASSEIAQEISLKQKMDPKKVQMILDAFVKESIETIEDGKKVKVTGFGIFYPSEIQSRTWINPKTQQKSNIPERRIIRFRPSDKLKKALNLADEPQEEIEDEDAQKREE
jgi:nucleoid DNA-binding protein